MQLVVKYPRHVCCPPCVGLGHQSALLSIQIVAASRDSSFPILENAGAFELTLLLLANAAEENAKSVIVTIFPSIATSLFVIRRSGPGLGHYPDCSACRAPLPLQAGAQSVSRPRLRAVVDDSSNLRLLCPNN